MTGFVYFLDRFFSPTDPANVQGQRVLFDVGMERLME